MIRFNENKNERVALILLALYGLVRLVLSLNFFVNIPHLTGITAGTFQFWQEYFLMIIFQIFNVPKQLSDPENLS